MKKPVKIVLLEDEESIRNGIRFNLEAEGYSVIEFSDTATAMKKIESLSGVTLGIFDIMLPGGIDGLEFCRQIRSRDYNFPVIFLSAKSSLEDKLEGFKSGGDDYLTKPFDLEELLARVQARLRAIEAMNGNRRNTVTIGKLTFDLDIGAATTPGGELFRFNARETEILKLFVENRGRPVSRDLILDRVWGTAEFPTNRTIDNYILKFRKVFEPDPQNPKYFITRHGTGYELAEEE